MCVCAGHIVSAIVNNNSLVIITTSYYIIIMSCIELCSTKESRQRPWSEKVQRRRAIWHGSAARCPPCPSSWSYRYHRCPLRRIAVWLWSPPTRSRRRRGAGALQLGQWHGPWGRHCRHDGGYRPGMSTQTDIANRRRASPPTC